MLDTTLFNVSLPYVSTSESKALVLSGCRVVLSEVVPYSEFDELNYYPLNCNDYGFGRTDIELSFENNFKDPYFNFFIQGVAIRTDSAILCKIDRNPTPKIISFDNYTKITKYGKVALGIGYYFRSREERDLLENCKLFSIESFVALKKKTNVYDFMCRIERTDDGWQMSEGNTYRTTKHTNIRNLYH